MNQQKALIIDRLASLLLWSILFLGVLLRIVVFFQNRSIFIDEANLANNIIPKSFAAFFKSLDYDQFAPPLFLCIEKCFAVVFGNHELSLRLFPLLSGIGLLLIFAKLIKKIIPYTVFQFYPIALLCCSPLFIRYATEIKQYTVDAFLTVFLIYWAIEQSAIKGWRAVFIWATLGSLCIWLSMPSIFILAAIGLYFLWDTLAQKAYQYLPHLATIGGAWLLSFGSYYALILQNDMGHGRLLNYHDEFFFPLFPTSMEEVQSALYLLRKIVGSAIGTTAVAIAIGSFSIVVAIYHLYKEDSRKLMLLVLPILLTIITSSLKMYSLIPRLILFFLPIIILLSGIGALVMFKPLNKPLRILLLIFLLVTVINKKGYEYLWQPFQIEELKSVLLDVKPLALSEDVIYVDHEALPAYLFYTQTTSQKQYFIPNTQQVILGKWDTLPLEVLQNQSVKKLWLIFSHATPERRNKVLNVFNKVGKMEKEIKHKGASAYLFTFS